MLGSVPRPANPAATATSQSNTRAPKSCATRRNSTARLPLASAKTGASPSRTGAGESAAGAG